MKKQKIIAVITTLSVLWISCALGSVKPNEDMHTNTPLLATQHLTNFAIISDTHTPSYIFTNNMSTVNLIDTTLHIADDALKQGDALKQADDFINDLKLNLEHDRKDSTNFDMRFRNLVKYLNSRLTGPNKLQAVINLGDSINDLAELRNFPKVINYYKDPYEKLHSYNYLEKKIIDKAILNINKEIAQHAGPPGGAFNTIKYHSDMITPGLLPIWKVVIGNHDGRSYGLFIDEAESIANFQKYFQASLIGDGGYYTYTLPTASGDDGILMVFMNTSCTATDLKTDDELSFGDTQLDWLEGILSKNKLPVLIMFHNNPKDKTQIATLAPRFYNILSNNKLIKAIFVGHHHRWNYSEELTFRTANEKWFIPVFEVTSAAYSGGGTLNGSTNEFYSAVLNDKTKELTITKQYVDSSSNAISPSGDLKVVKDADVTWYTIVMDVNKPNGVTAHTMPPNEPQEGQL